MVTVKYVCKQCGAEDFPRFEANEPIYPAINCWKCHAGMKHKDIRTQQFAQEGMFPEGDPIPDPPSNLNREGYCQAFHIR